MKALAESPRITAFCYFGQAADPSQPLCLLEQGGTISNSTDRDHRSRAAGICKSELSICPTAPGTHEIRRRAKTGIFTTSSTNPNAIAAENSQATTQMAKGAMAIPRIAIIESTPRMIDSLGV
jgi:hypothetical protein